MKEMAKDNIIFSAKKHSERFVLYISLGYSHKSHIIFIFVYNR